MSFGFYIDSVAPPRRPNCLKIASIFFFFGVKLPQLLVHSFIRNDIKEWDLQFLREYMHPEDLTLIFGVSLCLTDRVL